MNAIWERLRVLVGAGTVTRVEDVEAVAQAGGRLIGVLDIDSDLPDAFTAADSAALEGILHDVFGKL